MVPEDRKRLDALIAATRDHQSADFYRLVWKGTSTFEELPVISRADLCASPLSRRLYTSDVGMVKVVRDERGAFLSPWRFADIGREPFGAHAVRPMVCLSDPHEAIEKSMWCYECNMLPVIGEKDPDMAIVAADAYKIDALIADPLSLTALHPYLSRASKLSWISVIADSFDIDALLPFASYAEEIRLVLALPETGAIATAPLSESPRFKPASGCVIEYRDSIVVTKITPLAFPVIRYHTGIASKVLQRVAE